jgi:hypothetical protein
MSHDLVLAGNFCKHLGSGSIPKKITEEWQPSPPILDAIFDEKNVTCCQHQTTTMQSTSN